MKSELLEIALKSVVIPLSVFVSLLIVKLIVSGANLVLGRRALPIVVHDVVSADSQADPWQGFADLLRDYVASDPALSRQLAPGVATEVSPSISGAAPGSAQASWTAALMNLVFPQRQASYSILLKPHQGNHQFAPFVVNVRVLKVPEQWIIASKTVHAENLQDVVFLVGGYCIQAVQLQRGFLRRTPRWENWGSRGGYDMFRRAVFFQEVHDHQKAFDAYEQASSAAPGNVRIGVYRASLYELEGQYVEAMRLYDALHCLWKRNIEIAYRSAAVRVNYVLDSLENLGVTAETLRSAGSRPAAEILPPAGPHPQAAGQIEHLQDLRNRLTEAREMFLLARRDLRYRGVVWRWLKTCFPLHRDAGERRYWLSWIRRDSFRHPLLLLRRSKRHEYFKAVILAIEANKLLEFILDRLMAARTDHGAEFQAHGPVRSGAGAAQPAPASGTLPSPVIAQTTARFDITKSVRLVLREISVKRSGWLAHWTAACYFSRAALAAEIAKRKEIAIGEIGRVLRNPCNQLNPELLQTDPDMKRLQEAMKGQLVRVLVGPLNDLAQRPDDTAGPAPLSG